MSSNKDAWWLRGSSTRTDWMKHGLCSQVDPELFFPEAGSNMTKRAKSVCSSCPVMDRCMSYALEHPGIAGVWGGTTERDRDEIRRKRRAAA